MERQYADYVKLRSCLKGTGGICEMFRGKTKKGKKIGQYTHIESSAHVHCSLFYTFIKSFFYLGVGCISFLRLCVHARELTAK